MTQSTKQKQKDHIKLCQPLNKGSDTIILNHETNVTIYLYLTTSLRTEGFKHFDWYIDIYLDHNCNN